MVSVLRSRSPDLAQATAMEPAVSHAPAMIICTGTYWRNAWKYQARTYRHFGWDNGTLLANLLAVSAASGLRAEIVFVDAEVIRLLDLDTRREVSLCLVPIGRTSQRSLPTLREAPALGLDTIPLSEREIEYPAINRFLHFPLRGARKFNCSACRKKNNRRRRSNR